MAAMPPCCCLPCVPSLPLPNAPTRPPGSERVTLNVGGEFFTTSRATLRKAKGSRLESMLTDRDDDGSYFIDRDGRNFHYILNFLRDGADQFCIPALSQTRMEILKDARLYGIGELVELLNNGSQHQAPVQGQRIPMHGEYGQFTVVGAPRPNNEEERLARLNTMNLLHNSNNQDPKYDNITSIVAAIIDVPVVLISLVSEDEQWFKSRCGLDTMSTDRNSSFCATMLTPEDPAKAYMLVIQNASSDPRVMQNPLVLGPPYIRFYAGAPLVTSDGLRLGALCSIDRNTKIISAERCQFLVNMATVCVTEMERDNMEAEGSISLLANQQYDGMSSQEEPEMTEMLTFTHGPARVARMNAALKEAVLLCWVSSKNLDWPVLYANQTWTDLSGIQVTSPKRFPSRAIITTVDLNADPACIMSDILWNWMRMLGGQDAEMVRAVQDELVEHPRSTRTFAVSTVLRVPGRESCVLRCRFTPAAAPMDANAASIRIPDLCDMPQEDDIVPQSWGPGGLFFVTIVPRSMPSAFAGFSNDGTMSAPGSANTGCASNDGRSAPGSANTGLSSKSGGDSVRKRDSTNLMASLSSMKPARSPFADVKLTNLVGEGSFAKVYFGLWSGSPVAVKVVQQKDVKDTNQPFKPVFEATLSASITHPNLVQTYKFSSRQNERSGYTKYWETWIVQEWCDKGTIGNHLQEIELSPPNLHEAMEEILEISRAGSYLHTRGIIHGDLTGSNVLLKSDICKKGHVCKVCDFGLARVLDEESREVMTNTMGTVTHMPPELFLPCGDGGRLTTMADVYAAGILLWQVVTRKRPFDGLMAPQVVVKVAQGRRPVMPAWAPKNIVELYDVCVGSDPDTRPSFDDVLEILAIVIESLG